eukprot:353478-Chlamydomonas_euryale.AAC.8
MRWHKQGGSMQAGSCVRMRGLPAGAQADTRHAPGFWPTPFPPQLPSDRGPAPSLVQLKATQSAGAASRASFSAAGGARGGGCGTCCGDGAGCHRDHPRPGRHIRNFKSSRGGRGWQRANRLAGPVSPAAGGHLCRRRPFPSPAPTAAAAVATHCRQRRP